MTSRTSIGTDASRRAGFTLVELLVVCALLAVVLGLSVGALSRVGQSTAVRGGERVLRAALTRARRSAMEQGTLARIIVDPGDAERPLTIGLALAEEVATIHFELSESKGILIGRNEYARVSGGELTDGGTLGRCLILDGGGAVTCGRDAALDPTGGFSCELDVYPEELRGRVMGFGEGLFVELGSDGSLTASLELENQERITLTTEKDVVAPQAWARIGLLVDGLDVRITSHGVVHALKKERRRLARPRPADRLEFGRGVVGRIDEVIYRTLKEEALERLEGTVTLASKVPQVIRFDAQGRLDRRIHETPVVIGLIGEQEEVRLTVNLQGVVR